jgi:hypothetical protein
MEVKIKEFCYTGPSGGTRLSNGTFDTPYPHPEATVKVTRGFYDYECGHRFIGEPADPLLIAFRDEHGSTEDKRVFFSEFDLVDRRDLGELIDKFVDRPEL